MDSELHLTELALAKGCVQSVEVERVSLAGHAANNFKPAIPIFLGGEVEHARLGWRNYDF